MMSILVVTPFFPYVKVPHAGGRFVYDIIHEISQRYTVYLHSTEILSGVVDLQLGFKLKNVLTLEGLTFDVLSNLDKDKEACSLTNTLSAKGEKGFRLENGKCFPINEEAKQKDAAQLYKGCSGNLARVPMEICARVSENLFRRRLPLLDVLRHAALWLWRWH